MIDLESADHTFSIITDFCQFGTKWRKRTKLLVGNMYEDDIARCRPTMCWPPRLLQQNSQKTPTTHRQHSQWSPLDTGSTTLPQTTLPSPGVLLAVQIHCSSNLTPCPGLHTSNDPTPPPFFFFCFPLFSVNNVFDLGQEVLHPFLQVASWLAPF